MYSGAIFFFGFVRNAQTEDIFRQIDLHEEWFVKVHQSFLIENKIYGGMEILSAHKLEGFCSDTSVSSLITATSDDLKNEQMYAVRLQKFMRALCIKNFMERQPAWHLLSYKEM